MGALERLLSTIIEITRNIDDEVEKGYDLSRWGDQMKFLHALQVQAQALLDMVQHAASLLGYAPSTYIEAGRLLLKEKVMSEEEFKFYRAVVGFRNIVVHEYIRVDLNLVEEILKVRRYRKILELAESIVNKLRERGIIDP